MHFETVQLVESWKVTLAGSINVFVIFFDEFVSVYDHVTLITHAERSTIAYVAEQSLRTAKTPNYVVLPMVAMGEVYVGKVGEYPLNHAVHSLKLT